MKKIVLFGTGKYGKLCVERNKDLFADNLLFCDNDITKQGKEICGIKVVSFDEVRDLYAKDIIERIVITMMKLDEVLEQCLQNGILLSDLYFYDVTTNEIRTMTKIYSVAIHSQDGEEMFLREFFGNKNQGVYVDVGAYHPFLFSNTLWAYERGWRGINIEPNVAGYEKFLWSRPQDINLNCGISETEEELNYYEFQEGALNTFCENIVDTEKIKGIRRITTRRLDSVFEEFHVNQIDFLDIDVEGYELHVLGSNNWELYRPVIVLIEQKMDIEEVMKSEIYSFMRQKGYQAVNKYNRTVIYQDMGNMEKRHFY